MSGTNTTRWVVLLAALLATVAIAGALMTSGTAAAATADADESAVDANESTTDPGDVCDRITDDALVVVFPDGPVEASSVTVYENTLADLVLCVDERPEPVTTWTSDIDGEFEAADGERWWETDDDNAHAIRFTNAGAEIEFAELLDRDGVGGATVTVTPSSAGGVEGHPALGDENLTEYTDAHESVRETGTEFASAVEELQNASDVTAGDLEEPRALLEQLSDEHETMGEESDDVMSRLIDARDDGERLDDGHRSMALYASIASEERESFGEAADAIEEYREMLAEERSSARSTVRTAVGAPLLGGILVGAVAGAAIPLYAARRVEESMRFSRNVSYDRKVALLPILVGTLVFVVGVAVLAVVGGADLVGVVL